MRLLLVENNAVFAGVVIQQFLREHEVVVAPTIREAGEHLKRTSFDAVLVDYDLDDGKGDALVHDLRAHSYAGRIVAISSHDEGNRALLAAGANVACPKTRFHTIAGALISRAQ